MKIIVIISSLMVLLGSFGDSWLKTLGAARENYVAGKYSDAWALYNQINTPEIDQQIMVEKAQSAFRLNNYQLAIQLYKSALKQENSFELQGMIHYNIALCYSQIQSFDESMEHYKESIRLHPTKAAKHNLLLLKQNQNSASQSEKKEEEEKGTTNEEADNWSTSNSGGDLKEVFEENSSLYERKIEKQLDDLERMDAMTKKKASRKITSVQKSGNQKDW